MLLELMFFFRIFFAGFFPGAFSRIHFVSQLSIPHQDIEAHFSKDSILVDGWYLVSRVLINSHLVCGSCYKECLVVQDMAAL